MRAPIDSFYLDDVATGYYECKQACEWKRLWMGPLIKFVVWRVATSSTLGRRQDQLTTSVFHFKTWWQRGTCVLLTFSFCQIIWSDILFGLFSCVIPGFFWIYLYRGTITMYIIFSFIHFNWLFVLFVASQCFCQISSLSLVEFVWLGKRKLFGRWSDCIITINHLFPSVTSMFHWEWTA